MKDNQCHECYKFCTYEELDSYTPFGCDDPESPEPYDPTMLCAKCSAKLKQFYLEQFKKGNMRSGAWQKSRAEQEAAKEMGLVWVGGDRHIEIDGKHIIFQYIPKGVLSESL